MPRNIRWDESLLDNVLNLVGALLQLSEQQSDKLQPKPQLYVQWDSEKLRVTGYETKQTRAKISRTVEVGTKKEHLLKLVKNLKLPQRQTESGSSQQDKELQEVQYVLDSLRELGVLQEDPNQTGKSKGYWKFTLILKHQTATKEENLAVIKQKWEEHPKNIKKNSSASSQRTEAINDSIDWREVCNAILQNQQEAARLRRKATEQGFEVNVYVPLGLVERKQQQRRQLDERQDRAQVYELTQEVIVKTYEHDVFLQEVITQQPSGNNKHIAIIGEPGAGKTTLLSTIASFIKNKTQDLPICISLANLQGRTIEEYLLKQWLTDAMRLVKSDVVVTPEIERQLIECFAKGGVWLLLDGVDEMGENSPVQALAKINRELTASLRQARVVLTCRLNVWDAQVNNTLTGFDTYKTQEFKPEQIDEFIHQWFERAGSLPKGKTLQDKLKAPQHENIRKLVTNPLRLSLLCQTFYLDNQGELPETKAALYDRFTRYFYGWKSELFSELCNSDDLKDELHQALSKLAFAGINSSARFRLRRSLARQEMGERLFKLACDVGWLNLVDRVAETDEEVYAFFHPNFQEYFAALKVNDWHEFLNHLPHNPAQGTYRIFEPQWREVILLWFGQREKKLKQQQQDFVNALVNFKDGCGSWDREDIDKGFYEYQAFFLAAVVIAEFKDCSQADEIVKKIVTWGCGNFKDVIENEAQTTLQQTNPTKAIAALVQLLQSKDVDYSTRGQAADSLEKIGTGNQDAIAALVQLLQSSNVDYFIRIQAVSILGKIGAGNQDVIAAAVMGLLQSSDVDEDIRKQAAASLGEIGTGNQDAITALVQLLQSSDVHYFFRMQVASSLGKIGTGNQDVITALVQLLQSSDVDEDIRKQAAASLGEIGTGNQDAITALVQLLQLSRVDEYTRRQAVYSLGNISTGNQDAIMALVQLLQSSDVDKNTCRQAIKSLRKIGIGNQDVIATLVQLLQSSDVDKDIRRQAADSLGKIGTGNQEAIAALVQLLQSKDVDNDTRRQAASSLGEIGTGNQDAIAALVQLLQSNDVDKSTRRRAADSLGEIGTGNQEAIAALVQLLQSNDVDKSTRRRAADSLGEIDPGNQDAIAALVQLLQSNDVDKSTRRRAATSLWEIDPGNQDAIAALVQLLQSNDVDEDTRRRAASSLGKVIQDNQHRSFAVAGLKDSLQFDDNYKVIWECSQNMPYPDFYQAWHQRNCEEISHNHLDLPQGLQAAIKNDPQLSQNIHLICIDTSKFIDPDNPASKIYTAIVKAGYLKCPDGTPTTMAELQTYWELLETNKRVVLVFHPGAANTTSEATYSKAFLNAITKFEGAICFISDPIPNYNTLKVFTPNQSVDDILEWLQPSR
ncbi:HEAT repeat domain-containing protein [Nostoc sp. FACHB-145]|uniref:HEAT repeat domain-containing protein n=1 Tax=Nostoc sp. FACHB-145 TaxID=2692836 RepID=UPI0016851619|nr:HEAT repeat domain-containing protein [Nostoc sp. FACHB-145]MBD2471202.1 HEAT repeat domain-containing protein [Nostoc sp. FACHB-145]